MLQKVFIFMLLKSFYLKVIFYSWELLPYFNLVLLYLNIYYFI